MSARTEEALAFIERCVVERGFPPSRRELGEHFGYASPANAGHHLVAELVNEGLIEIAPGIPRGIRITRANMVARTEEL